MDRNRSASIPPGFLTWRRVRDLKGVDSEAAYGCVDWYLYQDPARSACAPPAQTGAKEPQSPVRMARSEARPNG